MEKNGIVVARVMAEGNVSMNYAGICGGSCTSSVAVSTNSVLDHQQWPDITTTTAGIYRPVLYKW